MLWCRGLFRPPYSVILNTSSWQVMLYLKLIFSLYLNRLSTNYLIVSHYFINHDLCTVFEYRISTILYLNGLRIYLNYKQFPSYNLKVLFLTLLHDISWNEQCRTKQSRDLSRDSYSAASVIFVFLSCACQYGQLVDNSARRAHAALPL